jgi:peptidoglycan/LPS O-acetylase OafA/YrhL
MAAMRQLSVKALVLGLIVGVVTAVGGLIVLVAAVAVGSGIDITDIGRNGQATRQASIQLPILSAWLLALLLAGMTTGRLAGRALRLHGAIIGGVALVGALAGISRQDPPWAIALLLLSTLPVAIAGAHVGPAPAVAHAGVPRRWALALTLAAFCVAALGVATSKDGGALPWTAFALTAALLAGAVGARVREDPGG